MKTSLEILIEKANHDQKAVENLLKQDDSPTDVMSFHIQQMIEKLLKAFLVFHNKDYKPTHDLYFLLEQIEKIEESFANYFEFTEKLSPYAVLTRYEEGFDLTITEIQDLLETALILKQKIINIIHE